VHVEPHRDEAGETDPRRRMFADERRSSRRRLAKWLFGTAAALGIGSLGMCTYVHLTTSKPTGTATAEAPPEKQKGPPKSLVVTLKVNIDNYGNVTTEKEKADAEAKLPNGETIDLYFKGMQKTRGPAKTLVLWPRYTVNIDGENYTYRTKEPLTFDFGTNNQHDITIHLEQ